MTPSPEHTHAQREILITDHALARMNERKVTPEMLAHTIRHGKAMCMPAKQSWSFTAKWKKGRVYVVTDIRRSTVITVFYHPNPPRGGISVLKKHRESNHADEY